MISNVSCRVCTNSQTVDSLVNIFEKYNYQETVAEAINELTGLKVDADDELPHSCCIQCQSDIFNSLLIRRRCIESEQTLKSSKVNIHEPCDRGQVNISVEQLYELRECHSNFVDLSLLEERFESTHIHEDLKDNPLDLQVEEAGELHRIEMEENVHANSITRIENESLAKPNIHNVPNHQNYRCCGCTQSFETEDELMEHSYSVHASNSLPQTKTKPFQCNICFRWYTTERGVQEHQNDKRKRRYQCATCGQQFSRPSRLAIHENLHSKTMNFTCKLCGEKFYNLYARRIHVNSAHNPQKTETYANQNVCTQCGKSFRSTWYLKNHLKLHADETPHKCTVCGGQFKLKVYLKWHMRIHSGLFSCKYCELAFKCPSDLNEHQKRHTGHKTFPCATCDKHYYSKKGLNKHRRTHDKKRRIGTP